VWNYVTERLCLKSVLDLGSGMGHASEFFFGRGLRVLAVEGETSNVANSWSGDPLRSHPRSGTRACRSRALPGSRRARRKQYLDNLLESMCSGRFILMTNALLPVRAVTITSTSSRPSTGSTTSPTAVAR
jgi:hypothetical protein